MDDRLRDRFVEAVRGRHHNVHAGVASLYDFLDALCGFFLMAFIGCRTFNGLLIAFKSLLKGVGMLKYLEGLLRSS